MADFQSDQSSTQCPTSTTESDDSDSVHIEDEVDEFSFFSLIQGIILSLAVAKNHRKVTLRDLIAAQTVSLTANKMKQGTLWRNLQQAMKIWEMITYHFTTVLFSFRL